MTETDSGITRGYKSITRSYERGGEVMRDITRGYRDYNEKL